MYAYILCQGVFRSQDASDHENWKKMLGLGTCLNLHPNHSGKWESPQPRNNGHDFISFNYWDLYSNYVLYGWNWDLTNSNGLILFDTSMPIYMPIQVDGWYYSSEKTTILIKRNYKQL